MNGLTQKTLDIARRVDYLHNMEQKFKINQICFDSENKEFVQISNGVEIAGVLRPTEAIAIRFICLEGGKPTLAFTYRQVKPAFLSEATHNSFAALFESPKKPEHYSFIGRV